ncbi:MAG: hypothetical protein WC196_07045 [Bacilli bacterium]
MTETSFLWDGVVTGDATYAPYNKTEFNKYMCGIHVETSDDVYVIPGYLNDLNITWTGGYSVSVNSGAAIIQNYVYINDAPLSLGVTKPSYGYYRYDYVVLQLNTSDQTIRLVIKEGIGVSDYTLLERPVLTQTGAIWESPIALLYVTYLYPNYIPQKYILDERKFAVTNYTLSKYSQNNLLSNSEFMCFNGSGIPENWDDTIFGTVTTATAAEKTSIMSRGQSFSVNSGRGYFQNVWLRGVAVNTPYTLRVSFKEIDGDTSRLEARVYSINSSGSATATLAVQEFIELTADDEIDFSITFKITSVPTNFYGFRIQFISDGGITNIGQPIFVEGYHPGPFRQFHEYIGFTSALADAAWTDTAKSTGTTTVDLTASFNGEIQPQTKAVVARLRARDQGSAAGTASIGVLGYVAPFTADYGRLELDGVTNDVYRELTCVVPVNQPIYNAQSSVPQFRIDVVATGVGTLDATVELLGAFI